MATVIVGGPLTKRLSMDEGSHRTYTVKFRVESDNQAEGTADGPQQVRNTPGLPIPGNIYQIDADLDVWAYCLPNVEIDPQNSDYRPAQFWILTYTFTTKPITRPIMNDVQDPMVEPPKITITPRDYTEEAVYDRFRRKITNSAHELFRGPQNEWEFSRAVVRIEQNVPLLDAATLFPLNNTLNSVAMWGFPARFIKMKIVQLQQLYIKFFTFWKRTLDFEIWVREDEDGNPISGWDRQLLDEGTKVLRGKWTNLGTAADPRWTWELIGNPNRNNPSDFIRFQDVNGNLARVVLDGAGKPYVPAITEVATCAQCPGGAPDTWTIYGFNGSLSVDGSDVIVNGAELTHSSGCSWSYSGGGVTLNLDYSAPSWILTVSGLSASTLVYTKAGASWACLADNELTGSAGNPAAAPATLTLSPSSSAGSEEGKIYVQKYQQGDFLLSLYGVPAFIGP